MPARIYFFRHRIWATIMTNSHVLTFLTYKPTGSKSKVSQLLWQQSQQITRQHKQSKMSQHLVLSRKNCPTAAASWKCTKQIILRGQIQWVQSNLRIRCKSTLSEWLCKVFPSLRMICKKRRMWFSNWRRCEGNAKMRWCRHRLRILLTHRWRISVHLSRHCWKRASLRRVSPFSTTELWTRKTLKQTLKTARSHYTKFRLHSTK